MAKRVDAAVAWGILGDPPWEAPSASLTTDLPSHCDAAIAGAGITGLACAIALADAGCHAVVFDRSFGTGAAARSGGIVLGETLAGPLPDFESCETALREWLATHAPSLPGCWTGCWELARDPSIPDSPIDWNDHGRVRVLRTVPGGALDPAALLTALATAAVQRGVTFIDGATLTEYETDRDGVLLTIGQRRLRAGRALMAFDAVSRVAQDDPWPERFLTVALQTEVIDDNTARAMGWHSRLPFYTNALPLLWGRGLPDGTMVAGRELIPIDTLDEPALRRAIAEAGSHLAARIRSLHPRLQPIGVRRIWAGPIARNTAGVPTLRPDSDVSGVWWAGGYAGHGLAQAFRLGTLAASRLLGETLT